MLGSSRLRAREDCSNVAHCRAQDVCSRSRAKPWNAQCLAALEALVFRDLSERVECLTKGDFERSETGGSISRNKGGSAAWALQEQDEIDSRRLNGRVRQYKGKRFACEVEQAPSSKVVFNIGVRSTSAADSRRRSPDSSTLADGQWGCRPSATDLASLCFHLRIFETLR